MLLSRFSIFLYIIFLLCACNENKPLKHEIDKTVELHIECVNEKILLEDSIQGLDISFDTIKSIKAYWKELHRRLRIKREKIYPYVEVKADKLSSLNVVKIPLVELGDWYNDSRLKIWFYCNEIDTNRLHVFYERIFYSEDTSEGWQRSEVSLFFDRDSIIDMASPLKVIANSYLSFQRESSKEFFKKPICDLSVDEIKALKKSLPFRIHLKYMMSTKALH